LTTLETMLHLGPEKNPFGNLPPPTAISISCNKHTDVEHGQISSSSSRKIYISPHQGENIHFLSLPPGNLPRLVQKPVHKQIFPLNVALLTV